MPNIRYVGPFDRRELELRALQDPGIDLPADYRDVTLVWERHGPPMKLSDEETQRLLDLTDHREWRVTGVGSASRRDQASASEQPQEASETP